MGGQVTCTTHGDTAARFNCIGCNLFLCENCAKHTWVKDHFEDLCGRCGRPLGPLPSNVVVAQTTHDRGPGELAAQFPSILAFPFRPSIMLMMLGLALIVAPLLWAARNNIHPMIAAIGFGFALVLEAAIYFRIVLKSAHGIDEIEAPDASDLIQDMFAPAIRYLWTLIPMLVAILWWAEVEKDTLWGFFVFAAEPMSIFDHTGPATVMLIGIAIWPMTTVAAANGASFLEMFNPVSWVINLRVMGLTYVVGGLAFYALVAFEGLLLEPGLIKLQAEIDIWGVTSVAILFIAYLAMALRGRLLGVMVEPYIGLNE